MTMLGSIIVIDQKKLKGAPKSTVTVCYILHQELSATINNFRDLHILVDISIEAGSFIYFQEILNLGND